jgi:hypothetical protein
VNVVVLIIKIQITIQNGLAATFVSLGGFFTLPLNVAECFGIQPSAMECIRVAPIL